MNSRELVRNIQYMFNNQVDVQFVTAENINSVKIIQSITIIVVFCSRNPSSNVGHFVCFFITKNGETIECAFFDSWGKDYTFYFNDFPFTVTEINHCALQPQHSKKDSFIILFYLRLRAFGFYDHEHAIDLLRFYKEKGGLDVWANSNLTIFDHVQRTSKRGKTYYSGDMADYLKK